MTRDPREEKYKRMRDAGTKKLLLDLMDELTAGRDVDELDTEDLQELNRLMSDYEQL